MMSSGKIFIRERRKVKEGEKKPRFAIVAVAGTDVKFKVKHIRKMEIEQIAAAVGAELVFLEAGKHDDDDGDDDDE
jgi:hypothetical protein